MSKYAVWDYFTKVDLDASKTHCNECDKLFSLGSDKPKLQTVSGLKGHLASCHKELHSTYIKRIMNDVQRKDENRQLIAKSYMSQLTFGFGRMCRLTLGFGFGFSQKSIVNFQPSFCFSRNKKICFGRSLVKLHIIFYVGMFHNY